MHALAVVSCGPECACRRFAPVQGPRCRCGLYLLGDRCPYCEGVGLTANRNVRAEKPAPAKAETLASFDARMRELGHGKALDEVVGGGIEGGDVATAHGCTTPSDLDPQPRPARKRPPRERRSKEDMARVRAAHAREDEQRALLVTPAWLRENEIEAKRFLEEIRDEA